MAKAEQKQPIVLHSGQEAPEIEPKKSYERLPHEPSKWFLRFRNYCLMGRQRSVQAVLEQERQAERAQLGPSEDVHEMDMSLADGSKEKRAQLARVAIPGDWKRASTKWRWAERARDYDAAQLTEWQAKVHALVDNDAQCAHVAYRIWLLNSYIDCLTGLATRTIPELPLKDRLACMRLSQSLMKDIAREMRQRH